MTVQAQDSMLDSLPSSFAPDSLLAPTWDDSARAPVVGKSSALWSMASRDGVARRTFSLRSNTASGVFGELQHSDPGALRRRLLGWKGESISVRAGDLSPWSDHPLLEGTSRQSGIRDTALDRQFLFGAGARPNGVDLDASVEEFRTRSRGRWERDASGRIHGSGAALIEFGTTTLGMRASDSSVSGAGSHVAMLGIHGEWGHLDAAIMKRGDGTTATAFEAALDKRTDDSRWQAKLRTVPVEFRHDGISSGWVGGTAALASYRKEVAPQASFALQGEAVRDSSGKVSMRLASGMEIRHGRTTTFLVRAGGSENTASASRWFASARLDAHLDGVSPYAEMTVFDSLQRQSAKGRVGMRWTRGNQELLASSSMSPLTGTVWTATHKTRIEAGPTRLEFALSASGADRPGTPLTAQGSLACVW